MGYRELLQATLALAPAEMAQLADELRRTLAGPETRAASRLGDRKAARVEAKLAARARRRQEEVESRIAARVAARQAEQEILSQSLSYYLAGAQKKIDIRGLEPFGAIAGRVIAEGRIGMDCDRLYTLWQATVSAPRECPFIEIGSYKGGSARFIAAAMEHAGNAAPFYVCDTFQGHPRVDPVLDPVHHGTHKFEDTSSDAVREYLRPHRNVEVVVGDIVETSATLASVAFALVHLDVDVYPATVFCLEFFSSRLAPGAWIVLDDYGFLTCPGVVKAADDFIAARPEFRLLHLLTGQALIVRRDGLR
jgi:O-methyltransferase